MYGDAIFMGNWVVVSPLLSLKDFGFLAELLIAWEQDMLPQLAEVPL